MRPDAVGLGGFDSHTLPPHRFPDSFVLGTLRRVVARVVVATLIVGALGAVPYGRADAQQVDSARVGARRRPAPPRAAPAPETVRPPISPKRAFLYSLVAPGYGQSVLNRPIAGGLFFTAEVTFIALATKSAFDLRFAKAHEADSLIVTYATNSDGTVKTDSLGRPVGTTYATNRYATERVEARRKHLEDYYALIIVNHLLAGAEAFVSAQLWDLPDHVSFRALPFGAVLSASIPW